MRAFALTLAAVLALALPAAGLAQSGGLPSQLPQGVQTQETVVVNPPADDGSGGGLKGWQEALIFIAGALLIVGIGYAVVHDARNRAPVSDRERSHVGQEATTPNRSKKQKQRARAKAMQGRKQRRKARR